MAARVGNSDWQEDHDLRDDDQVCEAKFAPKGNFRLNSKILVQIRYPMYAWSPHTLTCPLQYFPFQFTDDSLLSTAQNLFKPTVFKCVLLESPK